MSLATKKTKATKLGITYAEDVTEDALDKLITEADEKIALEKEQEKIRIANDKKAAEEEKKKQIVLKDVDGDDVDQADYFFPRSLDETIDGKVYKATDQTAPTWFNKTCGYPVDREELIEVFNLHFPKKKGFLFYKLRDTEAYLVIVPLKYAKTISKANESRPGDHQRHAISFINEGSVNLDSLKMKLGRIAKHSTISSEPLA